jgi:predicted dehydrogenase
MDKLKVLVIGCGSIGLRHLRNLTSRQDVELAAADVNGKAEDLVKAIRPDIVFFKSLAQAKSWCPSLTVVSTPNHLHLEGAEWAFEAGSHVLCEKPLADTVANGRKMVESAKKHGRILAVGFTERYRAAIDYMHSEIKNGSLGNLIGGRAMVGTYNTLLCAKNPADRLNTFGNLLVDYTHELDILDGCFGDYRRLECFGNSIAEKERRANPSLAAILVEYKSGAVVSIHFDYVQHPERRILEIYGDRKTMVYNFKNDTLEIYDCQKQGYEVRTFNNVRDEQFNREHEDVIQAIRTGSRPKVTGEDAMRSLALAEEAIKRLTNSLEIE